MLRTCKHHILFFFFAFALKFSVFGQPDEKKQSIRIDELINAISDSLTKYYIFPDKAVSISDYLHAKVKSNAYAKLVNDPQTLALHIARDISSIHNDPHLQVQFDPGFNPQVAYHPTEEEMLHVKKYWKEHNYSFHKVQWLPGNIGYLSFNLFVDDIESAQPTIKAALSFLRNADALIIDLRDNMGGNPKMVSQIESYFFNEKTEMNSLINRLTQDTVRLYADPAKVDKLYLPMPIYILTSIHTFSGAEDFCYGMQVTKRAIVVGETTGGGAHPQMPFSVNQGFVVYIPFARSLNPITKIDWEGTGVIPNEKTSAAEALNKAQELIFKSNLARASDQKIKNRNQYYINSLLETNVKKQLSIKKLRSFIGTYGGLVMYIDNGTLYCKNNNNGGSISELTYLTNNLFVLDKEAQVEFVKDNKNHSFTIRILVNDGSVFEENLIKLGLR